jgi:hypothetical protein
LLFSLPAAHFSSACLSLIFFAPLVGIATFVVGHCTPLYPPQLQATLRRNLSPIPQSASLQPTEIRPGRRRDVAVKLYCLCQLAVTFSVWLCSILNKVFCFWLLYMHCTHVSFTFLPSATSELCAPFIPTRTAFPSCGLRVHSPFCVPHSRKNVAKLTPSVFEYRFSYADTTLQRPTSILEALIRKSASYISASVFGVRMNL